MTLARTETCYKLDAQGCPCQCGQFFEAQVQSKFAVAEACCCCKGACCGCCEELTVVVGEETVAQVDVEGLVVIWELVVELELAVDC